MSSATTADALRAEILRAATKLFAREGYRANAIAAALVADVKLAPKSPENERLAANDRVKAPSS